MDMAVSTDLTLEDEAAPMIPVHEAQSAYS